jgi:poly-gamma-glutamate capsule biosynthesis protein CapA/YwtB (metallophosphatase superfamily)
MGVCLLRLRFLRQGGLWAAFVMLLLALGVPSVLTQSPDAPAFWADLFVYQDPTTMLDERGADDIVIMATGDVLLARTINTRMVKQENFTFTMKNISDFLVQADVTWVNLETPLVADCLLRYEGMRFCGDPRAVAALTLAGVDVANIANNHAEDEGAAGVLETVDFLAAADIEVTGRAKPVIVEVHGKRIGLLGFNEVNPLRSVSRADPAVIEAQIRAVRDDVDYVLVAFHWGIEYRLTQNGHQRNLAKIALDAGADVVIGHHPHWVQGVELYQGKPIIYSLGNFIFDMGEGGWVNDGAIALITIAPDGTLAIDLVAVVIEDSAIPRLATPDEAAEILERMGSVSTILAEEED